MVGPSSLKGVADSSSFFSGIFGRGCAAEDVPSAGTIHQVLAATFKFPKAKGNITQSQIFLVCCLTRLGSSVSGRPLEVFGGHAGTCLYTQEEPFLSAVAEYSNPRLDSGSVREEGQTAEQPAGRTFPNYVLRTLSCIPRGGWTSRSDARWIRFPQAKAPPPASRFIDKVQGWAKLKTCFSSFLCLVSVQVCFPASFFALPIIPLFDRSLCRYDDRKPARCGVRSDASSSR